MLRVTFIPNKERFFELIQSCKGNVLLHLPDNSTRDLKCDPTAYQMLRLLPHGPADLCMSFSDPDDSSAFLQYMMRAAHA